MIETITNIVVLLACIVCIITLVHQLKPKFKRKPKRLFYVKFSHPSAPCEYLIIACSNDVFCSIVKREACKFTDSEYDRIKHLLPNDHTLELATNKK